MLGRLLTLLAGHHDAGRLPPEAWASLKGIIEKARASKWEPAAAKLYDFMKGQERHS